MSEDLEELVEEEEEEEEEESTTQRTFTRGSQWKSCEYRALVKKVLAVDPFNCDRGSTEKKWRDVCESMECVGSHHSQHSCKGRIDKLIYLTACESTLHQSPLCIQYVKIFTKTKFSNFHFVRYPVAL